MSAEVILGRGAELLGPGADSGIESSVFLLCIVPFLLVLQVSTESPPRNKSNPVICFKSSKLSPLDDLNLTQTTRRGQLFTRLHY